MTSTRPLAVLLLMLGWAVSASGLNPASPFFVYEFAQPSDGEKIPFEVFDVVQDRDGFLWLATARGLARYDGDSASFYRVSVYPDVLSNRPTRLFVDSGNRLYIASERGLSVYDGQSFRALLSGSKVAVRFHAVTEDPDGNVWFGGEEGIWRYDGSSLEPAVFTQPIEHVRALLWFGGRLLAGSMGAVYAVDAHGVPTAYPLPAGMERAQVTALEIHQGRPWGATHSGLFWIDADRVTRAAMAELHDAAVDALKSDSDGSLWFGGPDIWGRMLPDGRVDLPDYAQETTGFSPEVSAILEDAEGQIWVTSRYAGLGGWRDTPVGRISYREGLDSTNVTALAADSAGTLYVATDQAISTLNGTEVSVVVRDELTGDGSIRTMHAHGDQLLLGTEDGLRIYDVAERAWAHPADAGVIDSPVNALLADRGAGVWVGTDSGLYRYDADTLHPVLETSGLAIESLMRGDDGALWLGTEDGIYRYADGLLQAEASELPRPLGTVVAMEQLPGGGVIAATMDHGMLLQDGGRWFRIGEDKGVPREQLIALEVRGNRAWLVTSGGIFRAVLPKMHNADGAAGIEFEPLAAYMNYRGASLAACCRGRNDGAAVLVNDTVYAASDDGVVIIGTNAPTRLATTPRPYLKSVAHAEGVGEIAPNASLSLSPTNRDVHVEYSAVQLFRSEQVQFRYRLRGHGDDWVNAGTARSAQFQNLPPGEYVFELQASFNPGVWSESTAFVLKRAPSLAETVYFRAFVWLGSVALVFALLFARMKRTRLRHKQLEREIRVRTGALQKVNDDLRTANEELERSNQTDALTGLVNRRFFDRCLKKRELANNVASRGVLVILDIDFFKRINDSYGHAAGDEVLCQFAAALRSVTRESDLVARWGGEEFIMICRCPDDDAEALLNRVITAVRSYRFLLADQRELEVTCSIGAIRYPINRDDTLDDRMPILLEFADAALYAVKMGGRDGWALLSAGDRKDIGKSDLRIHRAGPQLRKLIDDGYFRWQTSRPGITLAFEDTVARLHALKVVNR